ncbi:acyltransferase [Scandinavium sp. H11S7]|uniref:Acyltransferase n=1 Tax=Scandinavium hiltneri TaxID=2926519 RepID=A0ABT2DY69_9ENTR|nr:acyltransferase [Scandinavium hiltneri]MCS2158884.1 acyltransferase [Scandinavium hiltneri]MCS2160559.1 acyltransferase [Scandinavium hiltneri]
MATTKNWSPELEGLRGVASLWVFLGHIALLVNCKIPIIAVPKLGVDLFILLSGYLMTKNYIERQEKEPWGSWQTIKTFWLRRYFRIAPLYYVMLFVALLGGYYLGDVRHIIGEAFPSTVTETSRYSDLSFFNVLTHLTFVFADLPQYAYNTALPDWSLGLEMQFYLLFPFIMLLTLRWGFALTLVSVMVLDVLGRYLLPEMYDAFPMPSMILIKLHMFIAGMFMAEAVRRRRVLFVVLALLAPVVSDLLNIRMDDVQVTVEALMILGMTGVLWSWQQPGLLSRLFALPRWVLSHRVFTWLGDVSYSVYLLHLLIVMPVIALLLNHFHIANHSSGARYLLTVGICMPVVYLLATFLHRKVEMRGITLGKRIIQNKAANEKAINLP